MRIGVRVNSRTSGGGAVFAGELVAALARHEHSPQVVVFELGDTSNFGWPTSVEVIALPGSSRSAIRRRFSSRQARARIAEADIDALICPGTEVEVNARGTTVFWPLNVAPFEAAAVAKLGDTTKKKIRWRLLRLAIRAAAQRATVAVYSSDYAKRLYEQNIPALKVVRSTVIRPAVSLRAVKPKKQEGQSDIEPYQLFVSHLYPYKMVVEMITAFGIAQRRCPELPDLLIAGNPVDQTYYRRIQRTITSLGLEERVRLLGGVDREGLVALYAGAEWFVFPSLSENAGSYALIDAMAYGLPVLCSSRSSSPEIVGDAAEYFDPARPEELANAMVRLTLDPERRAALASASTERYAEMPSWERIAGDLLRFLHNLNVAPRL